MKSHVKLIMYFDINYSLVMFNNKQGYYKDRQLLD